MVTSYQDLAASPAPVQSSMDVIGTWLASNWQTVGMVMVGAFSLLMLRSMVRVPPPAPVDETQTPAADETAAANSDEKEEDDDATIKMPTRKFGSGGPSLRDELREMVKENPDAAATVLRAWIGDAA
jgi:flagellar M-ring protein FliF